MNFTKISFILSAMLASANAAANTLRGGAYTQRGGADEKRQLTTIAQDFSMQTFDKDKHDYLCWEAGSDYIVRTKYCDPYETAQEWFYNKDGEFQNKYFGDKFCLSADIDDFGHYNNFLHMAKCHGGNIQAWNLIKELIASHYNGYCADLNRGAGGKFELKKCDHNNKDQLHKLGDDVILNFY